MSKNQLLEDVKGLEEEVSPTPESLQRDLIREAKNVKSIDDQIDDTIESILETTKNHGTSTPEDRFYALDAFRQDGFFIQVFKNGENYYGWAKEMIPDLMGKRMTFEAKANTAFSCGHQLVKLAKLWKQKYKRV